MNTNDDLPQQGLKPGPSPTGSSEEQVTPALVRRLQQQVNTLLILLLVVSGTLSVFLLRQVSLQRKEMDRLRPVVAQYNTNVVPRLQEFMNQLGEYSRTHPEVMPILTKYGLVQHPAAGPGTSSSTEPAPAIPPAQP